MAGDEVPVSIEHAEILLVSHDVIFRAVHCKIHAVDWGGFLPNRVVNLRRVRAKAMVERLYEGRLPNVILA
ncbi:hypothetical protein D3C80_1996920 [compost metagenome]